jgi:hypothetical protein
LSEKFALLFRRFRAREFLEARIIPQQIEHRIEPKQRWSNRAIAASRYLPQSLEDRDRVIGISEEGVGARSIFARSSISGRVATSKRGRCVSIVGLFINPNGYADGFATVYGYPYEILGGASGINDSGLVCGVTTDVNGVVVGFTAQLPLQPTGP